MPDTEGRGLLRPVADEAFAALFEQLARPAAGVPEPAELDDTLNAYRQAAAVLDRFVPAALGPVDAEPAPLAIARFLAECETISGKTAPRTSRRPSGDRTTDRAIPEIGIVGYRLGADARRATLRAMSPEMIKSARSAYREADDPHFDRFAQSVLDDALTNRLPPIQDLDAERLAVLRRLTPALADTPYAPASIADVDGVLARTRLLAPLQRMIGNNAEHFAGRHREQDLLRTFVGALDAQTWLGAVDRVVGAVQASFAGRARIMVLHGPGGVGKSSLLGKFLIDHVGRRAAQPIPFAYVDLDRPDIEGYEAGAVFAEALRQLGAQRPQLSEAVSQALAPLRTIRQAETATESSLPDTPVHQADAVAWFNSVIKQITGTPALLLVLDTFEEAQRYGVEVVDRLLGLLGRACEADPRLYVVLSGRSSIASIDAGAARVKTDALALANLETSDAVDALRRHLVRFGVRPPSPTVLASIVADIGGHPLSLVLAARIIKQQGVSALTGIQSRRYLIFKVANAEIQTILYERLLGHLGDGRLEKIAHPGLALRRLTADVIRKVLAEPCQLVLESDESANDLFQRLEGEAWLLDPDDGPEPALKHRADVRTLMLPLIDREYGALVAKIDTNAVAYYAGRDSVIDRAEEIYHRLRLGQTRSDIEPRWLPEAENRLRPALDDLKGNAHVLLASLLGITVDPAVRKAASDSEWQRSALVAARNFRLRNNYAAARSALLERPDVQTPALQLELASIAFEQHDLTESERYANAVLVGRSDSARDDLEAFAGAYALLARIQRWRGDARGAVRLGLNGLTMLRHLIASAPSDDAKLDLVFVLANLVTSLRAGDPGEAVEVPEELIGDFAGARTRASIAAMLERELLALAMDDRVLGQFRERPSIQREVAATLGGQHPDLLVAALRSTSLGPEELERLGAIVHRYDASHAQAASDPSALTDVVIAGIRDGRLGRKAMDEIGLVLGDFLKRTGGRAK
jgi:hypothetical protein